MDTLAENRKNFQRHRNNQIERILEAAERLFIQHGIDNVSMDTIADAARLSRKTVYQYFPNKKEIAFAIFQKMVDDLAQKFDPDKIAQGNGFQRLERYVEEIVNLFETEPDHLRFMVEFDALYAREGDPARVRRTYAEGAEMLTPIIQQGITDGSIRPDFEADFVAAALLNLVSGMNSRFALLGDQIQEEYGQSVKELYLGILRIFLQGIRGTNPGG